VPQRTPAGIRRGWRQGKRGFRASIVENWELVRPRHRLLHRKGVWAGAKRRPFRQPETGKKGSRRRVSMAPPLGGTRDRLPPARGAIDLARGIEARRAETTGSACESPVRRRRTRQDKITTVWALLQESEERSPWPTFAKSAGVDEHALRLSSHFQVRSSEALRRNGRGRTAHDKLPVLRPGRFEPCKRLVRLPARRDCVVHPSHAGYAAQGSHLRNHAGLATLPLRIKWWRKCRSDAGRQKRSLA
jgi:hypothetical protein